MSLAFADEFNGTTLNTSVWKPYHSTYGDGNNELQCHTPNNVTLSGGTMKITARRGTVTCPNGAVRNYSSAFLGTRETGTYFPAYGRFEIRAKVPHGQGLWPAFWLRHRNGASTAEVDIMEYFHSQVPGKTTGTLHLDGRYNLSKRTTWLETPTASPGWHTWAVDILPVSTGVQFTFLLDGTAYHTYTDTQRKWASLVSSSGMWDIAVNMSVGGDWVGDPAGTLGYLSDLGRCAQGGTAPNGCTTTGIRRADFASTYEVDYVRVFRKN
jgi:beta-glucanase (GH16 family)